VAAKSGWIYQWCDQDLSMGEGGLVAKFLAAGGKGVWGRGPQQ